MLRRRTSLLLVVLALGVAACDGDAADAEGAPPPDTADAFTAQADEICEGARPELDAERAALFDDLPIEPEDAQQSFERAGALLATQLTQLQDLALPAEAEDAARTWLDQLEQATQAYQEAGESADAAAQLVGGPDPLEDALRAADELDMRTCGTDPGLPTDELGEPVPDLPDE